MGNGCDRGEGGMSDKNLNGWSHSWTQPYQSFNSFFQGQSCKEIYDQLQTEKEIDRLEIVDNIIGNMETYPDAEKIMNKIMGRNYEGKKI
jgi:hypothetical protein